ncbi:MAG TPA: cell envelope integrity protein CreD [Pararhizobium sp.]|uniref:cell envelope integrity protein CreD n=1 Tax=Pararhizobium sp. TaxID=1977563 RepID=UPI002C60755E|nr:cell envelope integrity protein CreD [Pararhizobium sp.]HTO30196.1 cell envelope integrity protein CreD [Pararhizobium sp.]
MTDTDSSPEGPSGEPQPAFISQSPDRAGTVRTVLSSPGIKFIMIGFISMALLIPTLLVWGLVEERGKRAEEVSARIATGWGGPQILNGPYLAVPFEVNRNQTIDGRIVWQTVTEWALLMPDTLNVDTRLATEERRLSIYTLPVYNAKINVTGRFPPNMTEDLRQIEGKPDLDRAMLVMSIADITGIRSDAGVRIDGGALMPFDPGMKAISSAVPGNFDKYSSPVRLDGGVNRPIGRTLVENGFTFAIDLSLNGSGSFAIAPAGQTTRFSAEANWPHPGFEGLFLPEEKTIDDHGFSAKWTIPYLARGVDRVVTGPVMPLANSLMTVNMVEPVKFYQVVARTLKYSIGFFSVVFLAVFIIELKSARKVHWVQYVLTGLALVVFYVLLLALAEHTGFEIAYVLASFATAGLISTYVGSVTGSVRRGVVLALVLATAYAIMYLILREDEYALLAGALISFVTIAATMFSTRKVDWSGMSKTG